MQNGSFAPEGSVWATTSGTENYSKGDAEAAKSMAAAAGYDGQPIKFMVSTNYPFHYDSAIVYTKHLAQAGFKAGLESEHLVASVPIDRTFYFEVGRMGN